MRLTLGVVLRTVHLTGRVKGNDLVTEHVLTRSNGARDSHSPGQVVLDELCGSPLAVVVTSLVDLEEVQVGGFSRGGIVNLGHVVDNGTNVGIGPGVPLDVDGSSGSNLGDFGTSGGVLVASNLGHIGVHGGIDEAVVEAFGAGPLDDLRRGLWYWNEGS